jgi:VanZ family protein
LGFRRPGRFWADAAIVAACGMLVSLLIETTQVFLPTRNSSLMDVLLNTVGSAAGALFWSACRRVREQAGL